MEKRAELLQGIWISKFDVKGYLQTSKYLKVLKVKQNHLTGNTILKNC